MQNNILISNIVSANVVICFPICQNGLEDDGNTVKEGTRGRGSKRKAGTSYNNVTLFSTFS